jgi:hypothetical protein
MKLIINNFDYTKFTVTDSVRIENAEKMQNKLTANLYGYIGEIHLQIYTEIKFIDDGGEIIFAGVLEDWGKTRKSKTQSGIVYETYIKACDYEYILTRRVFAQVSWSGNAGDYIKTILNNWLAPGSAFSENITAGDIQAGAFLTKYVVPVMTGWGMFKAFAKVSGFEWWIDKEKKLHFRPGIECKFNGAVLDLDDMNNTTINGTFEGLENTADLQNVYTRVYVVGKDKTKLAQAVDLELEASLKNYPNTSGVLAKIIDNDDVETPEQAEIVAEAELKKYRTIPYTLRFKTFSEGLYYSDLIKFRCADLEIPEYKYFSIIKTIQTFEFKQLEHKTTTEIHAEIIHDDEFNPATQSGTHYPKDDWTEIFTNPNDAATQPENVADIINKPGAGSGGECKIIDCIHVSSSGRVVTLEITDPDIKELPVKRTYQFNVAFAIPNQPIARIVTSDGDELTSHFWKWQNGNEIISKDFEIGARVQILDSGAGFFSGGAARKGLEGIWFQKAVGTKSIIKYAMTGNIVGIRGEI